MIFHDTWILTKQGLMSKYFSIIIFTVSLGGLLFGFDMAVVSGVIPLIKDFFHLTPLQEGWFVSSALIGCIIGVAFSGKWSDVYGRRKLLFWAGFFFLVSALGCSLAPSFSLLIIARLFSGIGVGIASIVVPLYLAEISPTKIRGRMVTAYQLAVTIGILMAYLGNAFVLKNATVFFDGEYWRAMFLIGAVPALLFCIGLFFIPESPRWLFQKGKIELADRLMEKLNLEKFVAPPSVNDKNKITLFSPIYRRALILGLLLPLFSQLSGINAIVYFGPTVLLQSGLTMSGSLQAQVLFGVANVLFTVIAIWKVDSLGRRPLYLIGTFGAAVSLLATGWCFYNGVEGNSWLLIASILAFLLFFAFSVGPLKFVVASEIFPSAIRGKAMATSVLVMWVADALVGQITPLMLAAWGSAWTFWFFAFCCAIAFITVYYLLPETKGESLEVIEAHWRRKYFENKEKQEKKAL